MRVLLKYQIPVEAGNEAIRTGKIAQVNEALMARVRPESAYFYGENGVRTGYIVFDLADQSDIPVICEPLYQGLNASIELFPVMNADDLQKGLIAYGQAGAQADS
jgi:hypothetical protein